MAARLGTVGVVVFSGSRSGKETPRPENGKILLIRLD